MMTVATSAQGSTKAKRLGRFVSQEQTIEHKKNFYSAQLRPALSLSSSLSASGEEISSKVLMPKAGLDSEDSSTSSSLKPSNSEDSVADADDVDSDGSFCLEDLMNKMGDDQSGASDEERSCGERSLEEMHVGEINTQEGNGARVELSQSRGPGSKRRRRRQGENQKGWEELSSCTVFSGHESCPFDMSSRSLLEGFDLETDNDVEQEDETRSPPIGMRFSAGKDRSYRAGTLGRNMGVANRAMIPMSKISEHTGESSVHESYSEVSGPNTNSFASSSPRGLHRPMQRWPEGCRRGSDLATSSSQNHPSPWRRCEILNIQAVESIVLSEGKEK